MGHTARVKRAPAATVLIMLILAGCGISVLHVSGDAQSVGAEIFIDGKPVGVMEKVVYEGSKSTNPVVVGRERRVLQKLGVAPGDVRAGATIRISAGDHELLLRRADGKQLAKRFTIQGENYLIVSFERARPFLVPLPAPG